MTTKHTPGPWAVRYDYVVQAPSFDDGRLVPVAQPYGVNSDGTDLFANARLIASAPDLLLALERIASSYRALLGRHPVRDVSETLAEVDAALAKARGET